MNFEEKINSVFDHESEILSIWDAADLAEMDTSPDRFPVGFNLFSDVMKGGVGEGDLVVISGKTQHGKTTLAQTFSYHFNKIGIPQLWFSYEVAIVELREKFKDMGLDKTFIGYTPMKLKSGNVEWIKERVWQGISKYNTKIVFIDHLGYLEPEATGIKDYDRNLSAYLGHITRQLKRLAVENKIIIFLMTHIRKTKDYAELDDIAHSSGVAQEADFVFIVERERASSKRISDFDQQGEILSTVSRISLEKNRRTGITKFIKCQLSQGRLERMETNYDADAIYR
jgi:predicted ATP-dependent serine protease